MYKGQVLLAILDFMPVILFGIGAVYLLRITCHYLSRTFYTIMAGGAVLCFFGGLYKAASKVLEMAWDFCIPDMQNSQFCMSIFSLKNKVQ